MLRHRISTNFQAQAEGMTTEDVITRLLDRNPRAGNSEVRELMSYEANSYFLTG